MKEMWEMPVRSLGLEDSLEEGMATHSSILAWRIPMDRGVCQATVHGVAEGRTRLSHWTEPMYLWASQVTLVVKNTCQSCRHKRLEFNPWVGKISWRRAQQPTPVFLPGESQWTEEPGGLQFIGSQRVGHDWVTNTWLTKIYRVVILQFVHFYVYMLSSKISETKWLKSVFP